MSKGTIVAVCSSKHKGTPKKEVGGGELVVGYGLKDDAHGGDWHRQVSLLAVEQIATMKNRGFDVKAGSFAENFTTEGFHLEDVKIGDRLKLGENAIIEVTQIGKECHTKCAVYHTVGECIMPEQGVFAKVIEGGPVQSGDSIEITGEA